MLQEIGRPDLFGDGDDDEFIIDYEVAVESVAGGDEPVDETVALAPLSKEAGSLGAASRGTSGQGSGLIDWTAGKGIVDRLKSALD